MQQISHHGGKDKKPAYQKILDYYSDEKLKAKAADEARERTYIEENKPSFLLAKFGSYVAQLFSAVTAGACMYAFTSSFAIETTASKTIAAIVAVAFLFGIEYVQRSMTVPLMRNLRKYGISFRYLPRVLFVAAISLTSLLLSYTGSFDAPNVFKSAPAYQAPTLLDTDATKKEYGALIAAADSDMIEYKKTRQWKGRLSAKDSRRYNELLQRKQDLEAAMLAKVGEQEQRNQAATAKAEATHGEALAAHSESIHFTGNALAVCSLIFQTLFFLSVWYVRKFNSDIAKLEGLEEQKEVTHSAPRPAYATSAAAYNSTTERKNGTQNLAGFAAIRERTGTVERNGTERNAYGVRMSDAKNGTVERNGTQKKPCEHCGNLMEFESKRKKYCNDDCRKMAWTERNGRKPFLRKRS